MHDPWMVQPDFGEYALYFLQRENQSHRSRGSSPRALVVSQDSVCKFRNGIERRLRRFTMRLMSCFRDNSHIDGTVAIFLSDLDLTHGAVPVIPALHDGNGHPDVGKIFGDVPVPE